MVLSLLFSLWIPHLRVIDVCPIVTNPNPPSQCYADSSAAYFTCTDMAACSSTATLSMSNVSNVSKRGVLRWDVHWLQPQCVIKVKRKSMKRCKDIQTCVGKSVSPSLNHDATECCIILMKDAWEEFYSFNPKFTLENKHNTGISETIWRKVIITVV